MADEDKQFEATPQKLKKVREEGQWYKSQDLTTALVLLALFGLFFAMAPVLWGELTRMFVVIFEQVAHTTLANAGPGVIALIVARASAVVLVPFFAIAIVLGAAMNFLQVGPVFSTKALEPKFDKLNPFTGIKNMFTMQRLVELGKNILKVGVLGYLAYLVFADFLPQLLLVGGAQNFYAIIGVLGEIIFKFVMMAGMAFLAIGGADFLFQRANFMKKQKMSMKEIKDEFKQTEGDPHVKQQLRQRRMQMMMQRSRDSVPLADVVVTNPLHVAVALRYTDTRHPDGSPDKLYDSPRVVAKGAELLAERIRDVATRHGVPLIENPPLARTLYKLVDVDQDIPANLYEAVAEVLLAGWRATGRGPAIAPPAGVAPPPQGPSIGGMPQPTSLGNDTSTLPSQGAETRPPQVPFYPLP